MDFLEKLNYLMEKNHLNKSTLSKACNIPYTTIDGWYKKGYEGLKLTTLRKLAEFFGTSLDYWASEDLVSGQGNMDKDPDLEKSTRLLAEIYNSAKELSEEEQDYILDMIKTFQKHRENI